MSSLPGGDPFAALGLPARPGLTDDEVRSAWRRVATATHPDRADGGDPSRFAIAAAAYTVLRTRSGRGEALADMVSPSPGSRWPRAARARVPDTGQDTGPPRAGPAPPAAPPGPALPEAAAAARPGPAGDDFPSCLTARGGLPHRTAGMGGVAESRAAAIPDPPGPPGPAGPPVPDRRRSGRDRRGGRRRPARHSRPDHRRRHLAAAHRPPRPGPTPLKPASPPAHLRLPSVG